MTHVVLVTERASRELEEAARWWSEHRSSAEAERWYFGFVQALVSLENSPQRCPHAREHGQATYELRQLAYGIGGRPTHRAVFTIRGTDVVVLSVRHLARGDLRPEELGS
jgi:plasmid stabilization system protein ParE